MAGDAQEVKSKIDIADIIGDYTALKRKGNQLWGLCPFHAEKTPSFSVRPDRQTFHCFGCHMSGDVFSFLMEKEGLSFREALELLADRAGVKLTDAPARRAAPKSDSRGVLETAADYFKTSLLEAGGAAARAYLERRALCPDIWPKFGLGWGTGSWDALYNHLRKAGFTHEDILASGVSKQGDHGAYDHFRGRVTFEVRDDRGRVVGFGGRLIEPGEPKYKNSPESDIFNKRNLLYLFHLAKGAARERRRVILTEGYMDAIRCHLAGFSETVASLGTALTENQAKLIKRLAGLCYIVYDADGSGRDAAIRGMYILQKQGVEVRVATVPKGKDPDDLLTSKGGVEAFEKMLTEALALPHYHAFARSGELASPERKQNARAEVLEGLASLSPDDVRPHISKIAAVFGVLDHEMEKMLSRVNTPRPKIYEKTANYEEGVDDLRDVYIDIEVEDPRGARDIDLQCVIMSMIWRNEKLCAEIRREELLPYLTDEAVAGAISALLSGETPESLENHWRRLGERIYPGRIARGDALLARDDYREESLDKMLDDLRTNALTKRYDALKLKYSAKRATDEERAEYFELSRRLKGKNGK